MRFAGLISHPPVSNFTTGRQFLSLLKETCQVPQGQEFLLPSCRSSDFVPGYLSGYSDVMCVLGRLSCFLHRCITPQAGFPPLPRTCAVPVGQLWTPCPDDTEQKVIQPAVLGKEGEAWSRLQPKAGGLLDLLAQHGQAGQLSALSLGRACRREHAHKPPPGWVWITCQ